MDNINKRIKQRFYKRVNVGFPDDCWEWTGTFFSMKHKDLPYGQFWWGTINGKDKTISAHRAAYILECGAIPEGLQILHKCNNSKCVNYRHLYAGTHENNMRDRDASGRTSKWDKRYNFIRTDDLCQKVKDMLSQKVKISDICEALSIGRSTVYRIKCPERYK